MMKCKIKLLLLTAAAAVFSTASCNNQPDGFPVRTGSSGIQESMIDRPLRYRPDGDSYVIENGKLSFNRSLYGSNTAFRVVGGDRPEFMLFGSGKDGLLKLGIKNGDSGKWIEKAERIITRYTPGRLTYSISDPLLGSGTLVIAVLASYQSEKMLIEISTLGNPDGQLVLMFGSASGHRFSRNGDWNTEPVESFQFKADECKANRYEIDGSRFTLFYTARGKYKQVQGVFPASASLKVADLTKRDNPATLWSSSAAEAPVLAALYSLSSEKVNYLSFEVFSDQSGNSSSSDLARQFQEAENSREKIAGRILVDTPDEFMNPIGGAWAIAADGCWQDPTWLHGAIGWRTRLNGWRVGYTGDVLGWHDRARTHFTAYNKSQVTEPATGLILPGKKENLAREAKDTLSMLYSSGYISPDPNGKFRMLHYDMNLVYIDALLWHLLWTGDQQFARQSWPVIESHLAWEKRCFDSHNESLYDAYCCIWASDALQYSGGQVTHSSAYNYRANKMAAMLAERLGYDPLPYAREAARIRDNMNNVLWLPQKGVYAEFKDRLGNRMLHENPALWSIYHTIDSEVPDEFQAYMMTRYVDNEIPKFPLRGENVPSGLYTLSTSNWHPYFWSINNVVFAEVAHTALAYWQANRVEDAYNLWKANLVDYMYMGSVPGNVGQVSFYDAARGEVYSDFSDAVGIGSRALVEGLFGIVPDAINGELLIRPGIPASWEKAELKTSYIDYRFERNDSTETYYIKQSFPKNMKVKLIARAFADSVQSVKLNGRDIGFTPVTKVGFPALSLVTPTNESVQKIEIVWAGKGFSEKPPVDLVLTESDMELTFENKTILELKDPQSAFRSSSFDSLHMKAALTTVTGNYSVFLKVRQGAFTWWMPKNLLIKSPLELKPVENPVPGKIEFYVRNNTSTTLYKEMTISVNGKSKKQEVRIPGKGQQEKFSLPASYGVPGSNRVEINVGPYSASTNCINWDIKSPSSLRRVDINTYFNDSLTRIYKNDYLSPRPRQVTLQLPRHGYGNWCHFDDHPLIDDSGLRKLAGKKGTIELMNGLSFALPQEGKNIVFVSQWDNYPNQATLALKGKSSHLYLLMTGSTNHMQSRIENGRITVEYTDGSETVLQLINPDNWWSIEQDMHLDDFAFKTGQPSPVRIELKTGRAYLVGKGVAVNQWVEGGLASVLDLPLDENRELKSLRISATANDVLIGLMAVSLAK